MNYNNLYADAAVFMGQNKPFEIKKYPLTAPEKGYALVRLIASGICGTDVHIHRGRLNIASPMIIGHEFIGEIADVNLPDEIRPSDKFKIGDKVIVNFAKPCGKCKLCISGDSANCTDFEVSYARDPEEPPHFFGGYGEYCYSVADSSALIKLPDGLDPTAAAMFPCAGPTIIHALKLGGIFKSRSEFIETAVVQGAGPLGLFSCLWLRRSGVKNVYALIRDKNSARAGILRSLTGCETICEDELYKKINDGLAVDLCIECSGNPAAFKTGCEILRNRGIYLVPGQYSNSGAIELEPQIITFKALQIIGSSQYDSSDVADYIEFLGANREICPEILKCMKHFKLQDINEAVEAAEKHLYSKVILV